MGFFLLFRDLLLQNFIRHVHILCWENKSFKMKFTTLRLDCQEVDRLFDLVTDTKYVEDLGGSAERRV